MSLSSTSNFPADSSNFALQFPADSSKFAGWFLHFCHDFRPTSWGMASFFQVPQGHRTRQVQVFGRLRWRWPTEHLEVFSVRILEFVACGWNNQLVIYVEGMFATFPGIDLSRDFRWFHTWNPRKTLNFWRSYRHTCKYVTVYVHI